MATENIHRIHKLLKIEEPTDEQLKELNELMDVESKYLKVDVCKEILRQIQIKELEGQFRR